MERLNGDKKGNKRNCRKRRSFRRQCRFGENCTTKDCKFRHPELRRPSIENRIIEEEYMNGTRVVIGPGFQVLDILFPQEYITLFVKKVSKDYSLYFQSLLTQNNVELGGLEIKEHDNFLNATVTFCNKFDAKTVYNRLLINNKTIGNAKFNAFPKFGKRRQISQGLSTRLKLSWATELSSGVAHIEFHSAIDGNNCIENVHNIIPNVTISRVHGVLKKLSEPNILQVSNIPMPPVFELPDLQNSTPCKYRFNSNAIALHGNPAEFIFKIALSNLHLSLDEYEIQTRLKQYNPKSVKLIRVLGGRISGSKLSPKEELAKLIPFLDFINTDTKTFDFVDSNAKRAGIYINFDTNNNFKAKEAFNKANIDSLGLSCLQHHRLEIEYTHSVSINQRLLRFLEQEFTAFRLLCRKKGIVTTEWSPNENCKFTILRFRTNRQSNILWAQKFLESITACTQFTDKDIDVLFTWVGRLQMATIAETGFIHWNDSSHVIWIYGDESLKENIILAIKNIIEELSTMEVLDKVVELDKKSIYAKGKPYFAQICQNYGIGYHHFLGNKLYLSGNENSVQNVVEHLKQKRFLRIKNLTNEETRECQICMCVPEAEFVVTTLCQHLFCLDCIKHLLGMKPTPKIPILCPAEDCNIPVALNDILKCQPIHTLKVILEVSVANYQNKHSNQLKMCPKPDCSQILSYQSRTTGINGGDFLFCDECVTTYCITCSEKLGKPTKSHDIISCEEVQGEICSEVSKHVREIQENILNLKCPRCKQAFYDFDACAAVKCDKCECSFCGLCLKDCGADAHRHVVECPLNPTTAVYVEIDILDNIHKSLRKTGVKSYITKILDANIRNNVCSGIQRDLSELGIEEAFIKSLLVKPKFERKQNAPGSSNTAANICVPAGHVLVRKKKKCSIL